MTTNSAEQRRDGKSTSCSVSSCGNFVLLLLDDQKLPMSTGSGVTRARELISIARDWLCLLRSEFSTEFSITIIRVEYEVNPG